MRAVPRPASISNFRNVGNSRVVDKSHILRWSIKFQLLSSRSYNTYESYGCASSALLEIG